MFVRWLWRISSAYFIHLGAGMLEDAPPKWGSRGGAGLEEKKQAAEVGAEPSLFPILILH